MSMAETETFGASALTGNQHDYGTNRTQDIDKDVGADERYESIGADAHDVWRTLNVDAVTQSRKQQAKLDSVEMAEREQRLRHTEAEFNQRMRHADASAAVSVALLGDMAEKLGAVYEAVVKKA